jgi:hypothetical protein
MKTRNGFVSNSSSSSFVCIGVDITKNKKLQSKFINDEYEIREEMEKVLPKNTDIIFDDYNFIIGWEFGGGSDEQFECRTITLEELVNYSNELEKVIGIKPKIIGGMRQC